VLIHSCLWFKKFVFQF